MSLCRKLSRISIFAILIVLLAVESTQPLPDVNFLEKQNLILYELKLRTRQAGKPYIRPPFLQAFMMSLVRHHGRLDPGDLRTYKQKYLEYELKFGQIQTREVNEIKRFLADTDPSRLEPPKPPKPPEPPVPNERPQPPAPPEHHNSPVESPAESHRQPIPIDSSNPRNVRSNEAPEYARRVADRLARHAKMTIKEEKRRMKQELEHGATKTYAICFGIMIGCFLYTAFSVYKLCKFEG